MKPLISVIVPVYNIEQYLQRCLDSLFAQTYKNLEIILVDDGSTDKSPNICDRYKEKDERAVVIHKENGGAADARNLALDICHGVYISFVDGDDYLDEKYLEILYKDLEETQADISICSWEEVTAQEEKRTTNAETKQEVFNTEEALENLLYQRKFDSAMWCKLYKRCLFEDIRFPKGNLYEDIAIIYKIFAGAKKIVYRNYKGYYYLLRETGTTLISFRREKMDLIDVTDELYEFIKENYKELELAALSRVMRANFHIYLQIPEKKEFIAERERIENNIKKYRKQVILDKKAKRGTKIALLMTYFGFKTFLKFKSMKGKN